MTVFTASASGAPLLREVVEGDIGALPGEGDGHGGTDSRVAAGDERLATRQPAGAAVRVFSAVGSRFEVAVEAGFRLVLLGWADDRVAGHGILEGQLVRHCRLLRRVLPIRHGALPSTVVTMRHGRKADRTVARRRLPSAEVDRGAGDDSDAAGWKGKDHPAGTVGRSRAEGDRAGARCGIRSRRPLRAEPCGRRGASCDRRS